MATIQYIHNRMINEALAMIVLAPKGDSSLQNRVAKILKCSLGIQENDFPDDLKEHWRKIASVRGSRSGRKTTGARRRRLRRGASRGSKRMTCLNPSLRLQVVSRDCWRLSQAADVKARGSLPPSKGVGVTNGIALWR
jgi:hypothetical protein